MDYNVINLADLGVTVQVTNTGTKAGTPTCMINAQDASDAYSGFDSVASAGVLGGEGLAAYLHPTLGEVLAAADVIVPLAIGLVLLIADPAGQQPDLRTCLPLAALDRQPGRTASARVSRVPVTRIYVKLRDAATCGDPSLRLNLTARSSLKARRQQG